MDQRGQRHNDLQSQLIERATRDQGFREELIRDPRGVIGREMGVEIPPTVEIRVVEETPTASYLVLPPIPATAGQQLSDEDLEAVAGGWTGNTDPACDASCPTYSTAGCGCR